MTTLTKKQIEALLTAPFEEYDDEESLSVDPSGDGILEVQFGLYEPGGYSRYVTPEGNVMFYNADTGKMEDATWEPIIGSYPAWVVKNGKRAPVTRTYRY